MFKQILNNATRLRPQLFSATGRCMSTEVDSLPNQIEKSINQVILLGRVGNEPQKRGSEKHPVVIFSLATNTKLESGSKTEWHRISVFKPALRDTVYTYLQKGQRVYVTGRLQYGEVKDAEGNPKPLTSIIADDVVFFPLNN